FFSSRRRHTICYRDWSSDVCSSDLGGVNSVAFSAVGHTLASGNSNGRIRLWDVADPAHPRTLRSTQTGAAAVNWVAFSPGGQTRSEERRVGKEPSWRYQH